MHGATTLSDSAIPSRKLKARCFAELISSQPDQKVCRYAGPPGISLTPRTAECRHAVSIAPDQTYAESGKLATDGPDRSISSRRSSLALCCGCY